MVIGLTAHFLLRSNQNTTKLLVGLCTLSLINLDCDNQFLSLKSALHQELAQAQNDAFSENVALGGATLLPLM
jgi:hypothetical protein